MITKNKILVLITVLSFTSSAQQLFYPLDHGENAFIEMYLNDVLTVPASLAGLPAISVSACLNSDSLPIGLQIIGKPFEESSILNAASIIEDARGF